jgi:hypothetical protein
MPEQEINPFDVASYSNTTTPQEITPTEQVSTELPQETETTQVTTDSTPATTIETATTTESQVVNTIEQEPEESVFKKFEWENNVAKDIYDSLVSGNISEIADVLYEQKVLSQLDKMDESDILRLKLAYDYPDLTPDEIEEEFASKYSIDKDFDDSLMTDDEISSKKKQLDKQEKTIARELKKDVREAKDYLQTLKQDISFPDILSQMQEPQQNVDTDSVVNKYLKSQEEEQLSAYQQARQVYESTIEDGLKNFDGFNVNYKDEEVQFDGKYALSQEEKAELQSDLKSFDIESFYGPRYYKDGKYDTKQLAEDIYFLKNRDKIVNSMVTQAVSKAKSDLLRGMKNIDYNNAPRQSATAEANDFDKMVGKMYSL